MGIVAIFVAIVVVGLAVVRMIGTTSRGLTASVGGNGCRLGHLATSTVTTVTNVTTAAGAHLSSASLGVVHGRNTAVLIVLLFVVEVAASKLGEFVPSPSDSTRVVGVGVGAVPALAFVVSFFGSHGLFEHLCLQVSGTLLWFLVLGHILRLELLPLLLLFVSPPGLLLRFLIQMPQVFHQFLSFSLENAQSHIGKFARLLSVLPLDVVHVHDPASLFLGTIGSANQRGLNLHGSLGVSEEAFHNVQRRHVPPKGLADLTVHHSSRSDRSGVTKDIDPSRQQRGCRVFFSVVVVTRERRWSHDQKNHGLAKGIRVQMVSEFSASRNGLGSLADRYRAESIRAGALFGSRVGSVSLLSRFGSLGVVAATAFVVAARRQGIVGVVVKGERKRGSGVSGRSCV
mmetsp:Transcript_6832/g.19781  ORF Transcript_6832/g.19781 Transcript_6832/m.19781 type:complete len:400 (+) Transcript_6832:1818-3017(+)